MAEFNELVKNLRRVRTYIRNFYLFGYRTRNEYSGMSGRSYDNERRRIESWLFGHIRQYRAKTGKSVSIAVSMEGLSRNPLFAVWRAKSFTRNDILLHFFILDLLADGQRLTSQEMADALTRYGEVFEVSTVRTKLREYEREGFLRSYPEGKRLRYGLFSPSVECLPANLLDAVDFFTEAAPFGCVGSYLQDALRRENKTFCFKHHFIAQTLDDEVLLDILHAMQGQRRLTLKTSARGKNASVPGVPMKILTSAQSGRRYLGMRTDGRWATQRLDQIESVLPGNVEPLYGEMKAAFDEMLPHAWGVMLGNDSDEPEWIEMRLRIDEAREAYVLDRLKREGRGGEIEKIADNVFVYRKSVWSSSEMLPFIKSFTGRILSLTGSNRRVVGLFYKDMKRMSELYGGGEGFAESEEKTEKEVRDGGA